MAVDRISPTTVDVPPEDIKDFQKRKNIQRTMTDWQSEPQATIAHTCTSPSSIFFSKRTPVTTPIFLMTKHALSMTLWSNPVRRLLPRRGILFYQILQNVNSSPRKSSARLARPLVSA